MPSMANITVQNASAANVIYVAAQPAAGTQPAIWTQDALNSVAGFRPILKVAASVNKPGTVRQVDINFAYPVTYVDSNTGLDKALASVGFRATVFLPVSLDTTDWNGAFVEIGNLLVSSLLRSTIQTGYAPT